MRMGHSSQVDDFMSNIPFVVIFVMFHEERPCFLTLSFLSEIDYNSINPIRINLWKYGKKNMEPSFPSFDVCIVCALAEEARAFLEVIQQQCTVAFEKRISAQYKYDYQSATIKNDKNEP